jgi:hypothetical protein
MRAIYTIRLSSRFVNRNAAHIEVFSSAPRLEPDRKLDLPFYEAVTRSAIT